MGAATARSTPSGLDARERRVLNPRPYRVFRKTYSVAEARWGAVVLVLLAGLASWVAWRGAHPDPWLYGDPALVPSGSGVEVVEVKGRSSPDGLPTESGVGPPAAPSAPPADRGDLPALASPGWTEGAVSRFDAENLYVKINGRADFFLVRGFRSLTFVTLTAANGATVDLELYDLGSPENALGAFSAERPPETAATSAGGTSWYVARNALFLARGSSYVRAIGSDETPEVLAQLEHVRAAFDAGLAAGEKPWTVTLFGDALGLPADRLQYTAENAFSFGFARNVTSATLDDGETELFVLPAGDEGTAKALAAKLEEGFLGYGERVEASGATWVKDVYLGAFSRATAAGTMVVGVKGAPDPARAASFLAKLEKAVRSLPPEVARKAAAGSTGAARGKGAAYE
ncbi:MAG: hypothetical protein KJ062_04230 [Thermoanaerobaculia bacterium]|nr:hypothetical protein [Thermoanaerobaculia bacterium]